jgi:hypothetical protein
MPHVFNGTLVIIIGDCCKPMNHRVRVVCDYYAFPVWAEVSISDPLREEFWKWAAIYEGILNLDYENDENAWPTDLMPKEEWVIWGRSLASRLKVELGDEYQIDFLDEISGKWEII